ncbi:hypothetical protein HK104_000611 [Borealophlyctis nickersoniae]|nr:hypothetical protein HK104_000611 [Borealophlyctis nickersoniae]
MRHLAGYNTGTWAECEKNCPHDEIDGLGGGQINQRPVCDHLLELEEVKDQFLQPAYLGLSKDAKEVSQMNEQRDPHGQINILSVQRLCTEWRDGGYQQKACDILNGPDNLRGIDSKTNLAKEQLYGIPEHIDTNLKKWPIYAILHLIDYFKKHEGTRNAVATEFRKHIQKFTDTVFGDTADPVAAGIKTALEEQLGNFDEYMVAGAGSQGEIEKVLRASLTEKLYVPPKPKKIEVDTSGGPPSCSTRSKKPRA